MKVTQIQFEGFIAEATKNSYVAVQEFVDELSKASVRRCINFASNNIIAASIDNERFYIAV